MEHVTEHFKQEHENYYWKTRLKFDHSDHIQDYDCYVLTHKDTLHH